MPDDREITPHEEGWFFRLLSMFGLTSRPEGSDDEDYGDEEKKRAVAMAQAYRDYFQLTRDRLERYRIFDEMDTFPYVALVLDTFAEEVTQPDYDKQRTVWIESKDADITKRAMECLTNIRMEDNATAVCREFCKRGDAFRRLMYKTGKGVLAWKPVSPMTIHRRSDKYNRLVGFSEDGQQYRGGLKYNVSWPWDYVHFRLLGKDEGSEYGNSVLEPLFRPWRSLALCEDGMLMYRLRRSPDRNVIYVDVGDLSEHEAVQYVTAWKKRYRKHEFVDPASANYKTQYNPLTPVEDIFVPTRGDKRPVTHEPWSAGGSDPNFVYDIEHFRNMFFGAARIPKAYAGFEGEINAKATLMQQDVRFARSCKRVRKVHIYGTRTVTDIHLALLSIPAEKRAAYVVQMSPISFLDEFERLELVQLRYQIVEQMSRMAGELKLDPRAWAIHVLTDYAKLPDAMVAKLIAKTPTTPDAPSGGDGDVESRSGLNAKQRYNIVERFGSDMLDRVEGSMAEGGYNLTLAEQQQVAKAISQSPGLRKIIGDIRWYMEEDLEDQQTRQVDPSLLAPLSSGVVVEDSFADDKEAYKLKLHMDHLRNEQEAGKAA